MDSPTDTASAGPDGAAHGRPDGFAGNPSQLRMAQLAGAFFRINLATATLEFASVDRRKAIRALIEKECAGLV